jgi:hypothetical protein
MDRYYARYRGDHCSCVLLRERTWPSGDGNPYGAGALIAMTAETMISEAFHNGPRYSGVLAAVGFAALILLGEVAR